MPIFANENFGMYGSSGSSYTELMNNNNSNEERFTNCDDHKKHDNNKQVVEGFFDGHGVCPEGYNTTPLGDSGAFHCEPQMAMPNTPEVATPPEMNVTAPEVADTTETVTNATEMDMGTGGADQLPIEMRDPYVTMDERAIYDATQVLAGGTEALDEAGITSSQVSSGNASKSTLAEIHNRLSSVESFSNMPNNMANNNMINNVGNMLNNNLENIPNNVLANEPVNMLNNTVNNVPRNNMNNQVNYTANDVSDDVLNLNLFLKSLLFACLFYILAHPETMKFVKPAVGKLTQDNQRLVMLLVFVVCYYIISLFI